MRHNKEDALPRSTTVGASFMNWRGDVALGGNAQVCRSLSFLSAVLTATQTQFNYGKDTQITARANMNRRALSYGVHYWFADSSVAEVRGSSPFERPPTSGWSWARWAPFPSSALCWGGSRGSEAAASWIMARRKRNGCGMDWSI